MVLVGLVGAQVGDAVHDSLRVRCPSRPPVCRMIRKIWAAPGKAVSSVAGAVWMRRSSVRP